ncbi:MAG: hypothetical protein ABWZ03_01780, partial [Solirubrobacterales bacterium]
MTDSNVPPASSASRPGAAGSADGTEHSGEAAEAPAETEAGEETGLKGLVDDLHARRETAKLGGGSEKIAKQHDAGKLTARERIDL